MPMLQIPDTVTSLAHDVSSTVNALAHDVTAKALPVAQAAGERGLDWGKQAVDFGRHNLQSAGIVPKKRRLSLATIIALAVIAVVGVVAAKKFASKGESASSTPVNDAKRAADSSPAHVA